MIKKFRPIKKDGRISDFWVMDTETWGLGGKLAFGVLYKHDKESHVFKTKKEFYDLISKLKIKEIYCHNLDFDGIKTRGISSVEKATNIIYAGGLLLSFTDETGLKWKDSFCLLKSSVSNLGAAIGYKKLETPDKFIHPTKSKMYISSKDIYYCKRDCKIVKKFLDFTFDMLGGQKLTIASASMYVFRKKFLKNELIIRPLHSNFKQSYYGGRVEAFKLGNVNAKVLDINSLYPYVMKITELPDPAFLVEEKQPNLKLAKLLLNKFEGCGLFTILHPKQKIGLLPVRTKKGKLIFPFGLIKGFYNFNEIRFALKNGCKLIAASHFTYSKTKLKNFFTEFVNYHYEKKNNSKGAEKLYYKFILNSLYGKFGENTHNERIYIHSDLLNDKVKHLITTKSKFIIDQLKRDMYIIDIEEKNKTEPIHQIFSICSYITSAARIELLKELLNNSEKVVYCDTDSIAFEGKVNIKTSDKLGGWSYENYEISKIYGNKYYKTNKGLKLKGVPKSAKIKGRSFIYNHFVKSKESIRRNLEAGSVEERSKKISFDYDKRIKTKSGYTEIKNVKYED